MILGYSINASDHQMMVEFRIKYFSPLEEVSWVWVAWFSWRWCRRRASPLGPARSSPRPPLIGWPQHSPSSVSRDWNLTLVALEEHRSPDLGMRLVGREERTSCGAWNKQRIIEYQYHRFWKGYFTIINVGHITMWWKTGTVKKFPSLH